MRPWFSTSTPLLKSVHQSKIFYQSVAEVPECSCIPWCSVLKTSLSFSFTGTLAEDTERYHCDYPAGCCWRGDTGLQKCLVSVRMAVFLTKKEFAAALDVLSVNPQTTALAVKVSDLSFLEECIFMGWYNLKSLFHAVTMSTLRTDTFKFTYRLLHPLSSKFFPSFMRGKCCSYKVTEKLDCF